MKNSWTKAILLLLIGMGGTFLSLCLNGQAPKYITPALPISLPLASLAVLALSSICVWGLLFSIPLYSLAKHIWEGKPFLRLLLPMLFLQAAMTSLNHVFSAEIPWRLGLKSAGISMLMFCLSTFAGRCEALWIIVAFVKELWRKKEEKSEEVKQSEEKAEERQK